MLDNNGFTAHSLALLVLLQEYCRGLSADPDESQVGGWVDVSDRCMARTRTHSHENSLSLDGTLTLLAESSSLTKSRSLERECIYRDTCALFGR